MITKRELAEQILLALGRTDPSHRVHRREVELLVGQVRDELLVAEYFERLSQDIREIPAEWVSAFPGVAVERDAVRQRDFVALPIEPLRLPGDVGLFSIAPMADEFAAYVPTRPGDLSLLRNHAAFQLEGRVGYWREMGSLDQPGRVLFQSAIRGLSPTVLVQLVAPAASIAASAPFPISGHMQPKIFDLVRQRLASKPAPDLTADNRDQA